jgi:hypothetical protein
MASKDPNVVEMEQQPDGSWSPTFPQPRPRRQRKPRQAAFGSAAATAGAQSSRPPPVDVSAPALATESGAEGVVRASCFICGGVTEYGTPVPIIGELPVCSRCMAVGNFAFGILKSVGG